MNFFHSWTVKSIFPMEQYPSSDVVYSLIIFNIQIMFFMFILILPSVDLTPILVIMLFILTFSSINILFFYTSNYLCFKNFSSIAIYVPVACLIAMTLILLHDIFIPMDYPIEVIRFGLFDNLWEAAKNSMPEDLTYRRANGAPISRSLIRSDVRDAIDQVALHRIRVEEVYLKILKEIVKPN